MIPHAAIEQTIQLHRLSRATRPWADAAERQTDALELIAARLHSLRVTFVSALAGVMLGATLGMLLFAWTK